MIPEHLRKPGLRVRVISFADPSHEGNKGVNVGDATSIVRLGTEASGGAYTALQNGNWFAYWSEIEPLMTDLHEDEGG